MYSFSKYKDQYKSNLRLALPVVLTQLGQILTQVADNLMVGRYGGDDPVPLAAVSFGGAVFFILFIAAIGIALGMTPLVGELYAQGDREKSAGLLHRNHASVLTPGMESAPKRADFSSRDSPRIAIRT